jgi:hypothetical protein
MAQRKWSLAVSGYETTPFVFVIISYLESGKLSGIVFGYGLDDRGFESREEPEIFLFTTASRRAPWPIQPPIQWVPRALSLRVNRPERDADHSPPSTAEFKNALSYTSTPPIRLHDVVLS